jgi:anthranilate phosphoribosyltransferase
MGDKTMGIGAYIKEIGRGKEGARSLTREQATDLMGQVLDGKVSDLELGAFCIAMRIKGETPQEMAGFWDAAQARLVKAGPSSAPLVVIPSYNGARKMPLLTPLLAMALAQKGLAVMIHTNQTESQRVSCAQVMAHCGIHPMNDFHSPEPGQVALVPTAQLHPMLDRLLRVRHHIGLRNSGHSLVKLLSPTESPALLITSYTHPEYLVSMTETLRITGQHALLLRATEGEPVAHPMRSPAIDVLRAGQVFRAQEKTQGSALNVPQLPTMDPAETARFIQQVLQGQQAMPAPIEQQIQIAWKEVQP